MFTSKKGFTLIELMIVVAIIGILAAIAIPNFLKFQAKSKQSEAKTNLKGVYTAETAYFGEQNTYGTFDAVNWVPVGRTKIYAYTLNEAPAGGGADTATLKQATSALTGTAATWTYGGATYTPAQSTSAFTAGAAGNISSTGIQDAWAITDGNQLVNPQSGI